MKYECSVVLFTKRRKFSDLRLFFYSNKKKIGIFQLKKRNKLIDVKKYVKKRTFLQKKKNIGIIKEYWNNGIFGIMEYLE